MPYTAHHTGSGGAGTAVWSASGPRWHVALRPPAAAYYCSCGDDGRASARRVVRDGCLVHGPDGGDLAGLLTLPLWWRSHLDGQAECGQPRCGCGISALTDVMVALPEASAARAVAAHVALIADTDAHLTTALDRLRAGAETPDCPACLLDPATHASDLELYLTDLSRQLAATAHRWWPALVHDRPR